jgi:hypothetical protein
MFIRFLLRPLPCSYEALVAAVRIPFAQPKKAQPETQRRNYEQQHAGAEDNRGGAAGESVGERLNDGAPQWSAAQLGP